MSALCSSSQLERMSYFEFDAFNTEHAVALFVDLDSFFIQKILKLSERKRLLCSFNFGTFWKKTNLEPKNRKNRRLWPKKAKNTNSECFSSICSKFHKERISDLTQSLIHTKCTCTYNKQCHHFKLSSCHASMNLFRINFTQLSCLFFCCIHNFAQSYRRKCIFY